MKEYLILLNPADISGICFGVSHFYVNFDASVKAVALRNQLNLQHSAVLIVKIIKIKQLGYNSVDMTKGSRI